jgi:hypothetical protein
MDPLIPSGYEQELSANIHELEDEIDFEPDVVLSEEQVNIVERIRQRRSVFFTGSAGKPSLSPSVDLIS